MATGLAGSDFLSKGILIPLNRYEERAERRTSTQNHSQDKKAL
jgi:hypothetical protein